MRIVVLAGGLSPERDVSLSSGALISNALIENGHDVMLLDLYYGKNNPNIKPAYTNRKSKYRYAFQIPECEPDLEEIKSIVDNNGSLIGEGVIEYCKEADIVFMALHGAQGENGQLQALFDMYGIKYTGTGYAGSLLAMDKDLSKRIMRDNGILTADWKYVCVNDKEALKNISFPCVVKPCSCGSSVGVALVENENQLIRAVEAAGAYEDYVVIENKIDGREFSVGILGDIVLPPIEIVPKSGFYDYKNKYQAGLTEEICPPELNEDVWTLLSAAAVQVHKALRLGYYSRIDFILDRDNKAYCLEANTLPGMTPTSLLPQEAAAIGITYERLCNLIAEGN